jgi:hypothetical protein
VFPLGQSSSKEKASPALTTGPVAAAGLPKAKVARVITEVTAPAEARNTLEPAHDGQGRGRVGNLAAAHLAAQRLEAAHHQDLQVSSDAKFEEKF